jgi:hypothetical protein
MRDLLLYTTIGKSADYLRCLTYFCESLVYTNRTSLHLLIICDKSFHSRVHDIVSNYAFLHYYIHDAPDSLTPIQASMHKVQVFDFPKIHHYRVALYVDLDCLFLNSLSSILQNPIEENKLYVFPEYDLVEKNNLTWFSLASETNPTISYYTQDHINFLKAKHKLPFNAGLFMFRITPLMERHFKNLQNMIQNYRGQFFYEQSFMNTYFNLNDMSDYTVFTKKNICMTNSTPLEKLTPDHVIVHFNQNAGNGKEKYEHMRTFWSAYKTSHPIGQGIFDTRVDMIHKIVPHDVTIVEIGVFKGEFAETLLQRNPTQLYLVDIWEKGPVHSGDQDGNNVQVYDGGELVDVVRKRFALTPNVTICHARSDDFLSAMPDKSIDVIYIDGDHSYEGCRNDLEHAFPKLRKGGLIMGHDYEMNMTKAKTKWEFGVKRAVDEFCKTHNLKVYAKGLDGCVSYAIVVPFE